MAPDRTAGEGASTAGAGEMEHEEQIRILESSLKQLIKQWERFFAGDRRTVPQLERERYERRLRVVVERGVGGRALQFRLEQLQHRFATYAGLWERQLREREEGRRQERFGGPAARPAPNAGGPGSVHANEPGALYERYVEAKRGLGQEVALGREDFVARLDEQRRRLERRRGGTVRFDVVVDGGKVRLAARGALKHGNGE